MFVLSEERMVPNSVAPGGSRVAILNTVPKRGPTRDAHALGEPAAMPTFPHRSLHGFRSALQKAQRAGSLSKAPANRAGSSARPPSPTLEPTQKAKNHVGNAFRRRLRLSTISRRLASKNTQKQSNNDEKREAYPVVRGPSDWPGTDAYSMTVFL